MYYIFFNEYVIVSSLSGHAQRMVSKIIIVIMMKDNLYQQFKKCVEYFKMRHATRNRFIFDNSVNMFVSLWNIWRAINLINGLSMSWYYYYFAIIFNAGKFDYLIFEYVFFFFINIDIIVQKWKEPFIVSVDVDTVDSEKNNSFENTLMGWVHQLRKFDCPLINFHCTHCTMFF